MNPAEHDGIEEGRVGGNGRLPSNLVPENIFRPLSRWQTVAMFQAALSWRCSSFRLLAKCKPTVLKIAERLSKQ